jgi:4-hydroxybenzoyl-CoA thioesterase
MHETNGIPTVDLKVQFKKAARLGEILTKKLWVKNLGSASILCGFKFENQQEKICLEGEVTLVNVAFQENKNDIKAAPFSEEMKEKIAVFLIPNS